MKEGFQHQTQLMQAEWLGRLREGVDRREWKGRDTARGHKSIPETETRAGQATPATWSSMSSSQLCAANRTYVIIQQQQIIQLKYLLIICSIGFISVQCFLFTIYSAEYYNLTK